MFQPLRVAPHFFVGSVELDDLLLWIDGEEDMAVRQRLHVVPVIIWRGPEQLARWPFDLRNLSVRPVIGNQQCVHYGSGFQVSIEPRECALIGAMGIGALETVTGAGYDLEFGSHTT